MKKTQTDAEASTISVLAKAQADAIQLKGQAFLELAAGFKDNPAAQDLYRRSQDIDLVGNAKNPNLFFSQNAGLMPGLSLTHPITGSAPVP